MRWKNRPEGSNWGDFGHDDQLGRANLIGPEQVLKGAREIQQGISFCLSLPLDYPGSNRLNPRRHPPVLKPTFRDGMPYVNFPFAKLDDRATDVICDDQVLMCLQYSTQWDSLAHVGALFDADGDGTAERVYYNGYLPDVDIVGPVDYGNLAHEHGHKGCCDSTGPSQAKSLGIENLAVKGMQGRGVLVDLVPTFGREYRAVSYDDLMRVMETERVCVEPGDMLLIRTGFAEMVLEMGKDPDEELLHQSCCALNGRDERLLQWITDSGVAAICTDNYAVERYPALPAEGNRPLLPLHHHCLFKLGLPLGELWYLRELAEWLRANNRTRFMLTAPPLRLPGAMGSPATPIATV